MRLESNWFLGNQVEEVCGEPQQDQVWVFVAGETSSCSLLCVSCIMYSFFGCLLFLGNLLSVKIKDSYNMYHNLAVSSILVNEPLKSVILLTLLPLKRHHNLSDWSSLSVYRGRFMTGLQWLCLLLTLKFHNES